MMSRIMAIDYGQKRVGIAVTDELQIIASPLETVHSKDIINFLKKYLIKEKVDTFVVGEPKQMDNSPSQSSQMIESFIKQLNKIFPNIVIQRVDERFTSKIALQTIQKSGLKKKDRQNKALLDSISATILLQSYLETR
jgi:putative holliday junction resolvase